MGACYLNGRQIGDDGRDSGRTFGASKPSCATTPTVDFGVHARRLAAHLRKNAARRYIKTPAFLDNISLGLSVSTPRRILAVCEHKLKWGGNPLGALVQPVDLSGARLYARWLRRFGERVDDADLDSPAKHALYAVAAE